MGRPLTAKGRELLADLPPRLRDAPEFQAVMHCQGRESDRVDATLDDLTAQFIPSTSTTQLRIWEAIARTTIEPVGQTVEQRRAVVIALLRKQHSSPAGSSWESNIDDLVGPGWTYQEHIPGDATTPPESTIRVFLPFPPSSDRYAQTEALIRDITPAAWDLIVTSPAGFYLDDSRLDEEGIV